ncbi:MAG: ABC transporter permease [Kiritimatiellia bacterium]|jgi:ribose transport system permease protein|nr:ABC transporter permease [Kiritimatiellia bacterium]MDP6847841.1 ABC transporter permease [Kiritimatiellia bacterium]
MDNREKIVKKLLNTQVVVFLSAVVMWIALGVFTDEFATLGNFQNLMKQMAITGVIGVGALIVILTRGIDLSVGSLIAFVNVILAMLLVNTGLSIPAAIVVVLAVSICLGLLNGVMVYDFKLPPFIATLGMMIVLRGAAQLISHGHTISTMKLSDFSWGKFIGIPYLFWVLIFVVLIAEIILRRTVFGRYVYSLGSNEEATRLSGINTRMVTYGVYMIAAFLGGIAGIMLTTRTNQGSPTAAQMFELDAIACAVLGGASFAGGEGNAIGSFIGALVMITIYNGCDLLPNVDSNWTKVIVGAILITTVAVDQFRKRRTGQ